MKAKPQANERRRLLPILQLAVILPAAALVLFNAWHLREIQRGHEIEAAIQRDFSEVLAISEKRVNHKVYSLLDEVRADFPSPGVTACPETLDRVLISHPYVAHLLLYDPEHGFIIRSQPYRLKNDPGFRDEADYVAKMAQAWWKLDYDGEVKKLAKIADKGTPYAFEGDWFPRGDKHVYASWAVFLKTDEETGMRSIAAIVFDGDYLRDRFFPHALDEVMSRNIADEQNDKDAVMMVHVKGDSTPLAYCSGWDGGEPEVERPMEMFPMLFLGMKLRGTTAAAIAKHWMHGSFLTLGALSFLLAGGIFLTYRNVNKELALARLKSDFVSNVSHELRTPLALIRLYAETLELGRLSNPGKHQEYYSIIRKESERLTALINNILDFSRIEAGRKEYEFRETDLNELVRNTLESYRYQIEQHGFTLEEKIAEVPALKVDREAMARSLVNLVNNALKYSQDRKYIGVNLYRDNGSVKLEVVDHGIGIPENEQHKIFEKFYRVGDPLVHNTKGSGLGLSLVQHIARAHGGDVVVDSTPGAGSKFTISLPLDRDGQTTKAASA